MNLIFFGAHPDDLEILCGGTIAQCVAQGHTVWMATATNGNVGSPTLTNAEIAAVRKKEAEAAAKCLGAAGLIWMNENDEFLFDDERTRRKFVDAVRQAQADVIVTHNPNDYHPDHVACSKLASDARILSAVRLIKTEHAPRPKSPELFYMDSIAGLRFEPQFFVDISDRFELKQQAVQCHHSQNAWLKSIFNTDLSQHVQVQSAFRGLQCGVSYAEAFVQPVYWPRQAVALPFLSARG
ncbi:MAG: PIG-L family deacetylase [Opitutaceae bacterium]|nr:PIG-L family deacetylase [Opitutaceae bacterium]